MNAHRPLCARPWGHSTDKRHNSALVEFISTVSVLKPEVLYPESLLGPGALGQLSPRGSRRAPDPGGVSAGATPEWRGTAVLRPALRHGAGREGLSQPHVTAEREARRGKPPARGRALETVLPTRSLTGGRVLLPPAPACFSSAQRGPDALVTPRPSGRHAGSARQQQRLK